MGKQVEGTAVRQCGRFPSFSRLLADRLWLMTTVHQVQLLLAQMTRAEKAAVLQDVVQDLGDAFPGIESRPGVCGGEPCIVRTRIPVWVLYRMRQLGVSEAEILHSYPTISAEDLANAWHFARAHLAEIEAQIRDNEEA
jgi:uncharacterized protein (DUF433 family)